MEYDSEIYANGSGNSHGSGTAGRFKRSPPEGIGGGGGGRNQPRNSRYQVRITQKLSIYNYPKTDLSIGVTLCNMYVLSPNLSVASNTVYD